MWSKVCELCNSEESVAIITGIGNTAENILSQSLINTDKKKACRACIKANGGIVKHLQ